MEKKPLKRRRRKHTRHFIKSHNPRGSVKSPPSEEDFIRWSSAATRAEATEAPRSSEAVMQEEVGRVRAGHPTGKARGLRFPKRSRQEGSTLMQAGEGSRLGNPGLYLIGHSRSKVCLRNGLQL